MIAAVADTHAALWYVCLLLLFCLSGHESIISFTALKNFSLENSAPIFSEIYLSPRTAETKTRYPLIPPAEPFAK